MREVKDLLRIHPRLRRKSFATPNLWSDKRFSKTYDAIFCFAEQCQLEGLKRKSIDKAVQNMLNSALKEQANKKATTIPRIASWRKKVASVSKLFMYKSK